LNGSLLRGIPGSEAPLFNKLSWYHGSSPKTDRLRSSNLNGAIRTYSLGCPLYSLTLYIVQWIDPFSEKVHPLRNIPPPRMMRTVPLNPISSVSTPSTLLDAAKDGAWDAEHRARLPGAPQFEPCNAGGPIITIGSTHERCERS
jgi:hypothetical protein